jgi:hypothetical protein
MELDAHNRQEDAPIPVPVQIALPRGLDATKLKRASEYLFEADKIRTQRSKSIKHRRYLYLEINDMFTELVGIYRDCFQVVWQDFRHLTHAFPAPTGTLPATYYARCYLSGWFRDLYYHIRKSCKSLSGLAELQFYSKSIPQMSFEYDNYLALLGSSIRPTHIVGNPEDTMYIPVVHRDPKFDAPNPFALTNCVEEQNLFAAIISVMKERKKFAMVPIPSNFIGRPSWMFDWHEQDQVCAPFNAEGNFNNEDITIAYILGTACTSKIGFRDVDDWQLFPDGIIPAGFTGASSDRSIPRTMWGSYETRTVVIEDTHMIPTTPAAAKKTTRTKKGTTTIALRSRGNLYYSILHDLNHFNNLNSC